MKCIHLQDSGRDSQSVSSTAVEILPGILSNFQLRKIRPQIHSKCCSTIPRTGKLYFRHFWLRTLPLCLFPRFDSLMVNHLGLSHLSSMSSFQKMESGGFFFLNIHTILSWKCKIQSSDFLIFRGFCHGHKLNHGHKLWYSVFMI